MHFSVLVVHKQSAGDSICDVDCAPLRWLSVIVVGVSWAGVPYCFCLCLFWLLRYRRRSGNAAISVYIYCCRVALCVVGTKDSGVGKAGLFST